MKRPSARSFVGLLVAVVTFSVGTSTTILFSFETVTNEPASFATPAEGNGVAAAPGSPGDDGGVQNILGCSGNETENPKFGPIRLPPGRVLTTICGTLFVKDSNGKTVWKRRVPGPLSDTPKLIDGDLVVVGYDLLLLGLDPITGELRWQSMSNGRASYIQTASVGTDMYAVLVDMSGYESCFPGSVGTPPVGHGECVRQYEDFIQLYNKDGMLREWEVPAMSRINVIGTRIFAVYRHGKKYERMVLHQ